MTVHDVCNFGVAPLDAAIALSYWKSGRFDAFRMLNTLPTSAVIVHQSSWTTCCQVKSCCLRAVSVISDWFGLECS